MNMKKRLSALLAAVLLLLTGCSGAQTSGGGTSAETTAQPAEKTPASPLTMTFLKVGKADGIILQTENHTVVIDCGEKSDGSKMVACLEENGVESIDYMILTHYDQDHIGGAAKVLNHFPVEHVIGADYTEGSSEYKKLVAAMEAQSLRFEIPDQVSYFTLDDAQFTLYPHVAASYQDGSDNNHSIVTKIEHGGNTLLFTGDAMQERLDEIMDIGDCDLLKVPYHGREIANLPEFLDAVTPEYAVICTSASELSDVTVQALELRGIKTFVTALDGNITAVSDGVSIEIETAMPE